MTEDVTPLMSPTMNLSRRKNVKRTSERTVSLIMLLNAQLSRMRSVLMRLLVIPPSPSAPSGLEKFALLIRSLSRSILPSLDVPRNPESSVLLLAVDSSKGQRFVMIRPALLSRMLPRKNVALSLKEPVLMLPSLSPSLVPQRSVLMYPRRSAPDPELTQER